MSTKGVAATARPATATTERGRNFLNDIRVEYGPPAVIGRLFLKADTELRRRGLEISFGTLDDLAEANGQNRDSWRPLLPMFDPRTTPVPHEDTFVMLVRNPKGEVVAAQGALLYDYRDKRLKEEFESMRLFYSDPDGMRLPGESARISSPSAETISGRVAFCGAVWYRPDVRGTGLVVPLGRANRAYAYTRWYPDYSVSIMTEELVNAGFARNALWPHVEWDIHLTNVPTLRDKTFRLALIWETPQEQLEVFRDYVAAELAAGDAEVDAVVNQ